MPREKTIAEQLNGNEFNVVKVPGTVSYNPHTGRYTFSDDSQAIAITRLEDCAPFLTAGTSTSSKVAKKIWKAV